jgi:hypothetical protein
MLVLLCVQIAQTNNNESNRRKKKKTITFLCKQAKDRQTCQEDKKS